MLRERSLKPHDTFEQNDEPGVGKEARNARGSRRGEMSPLTLPWPSHHGIHLEPKELETMCPRRRASRETKTTRKQREVPLTKTPKLSPAPSENEQPAQIIDPRQSSHLLELELERGHGRGGGGPESTRSPSWHMSLAITRYRLLPCLRIVHLIWTPLTSSHFLP